MNISCFNSKVTRASAENSSLLPTRFSFVSPWCKWIADAETSRKPSKMHKLPYSLMSDYDTPSTKGALEKKKTIFLYVETSGK